MRQARLVISFALLAISAGWSVAADDIGPAVLLFIAGLALMPRSVWKSRGRRTTRADSLAVLAVIAALALTLLIPDGPVLWITVVLILVAYIASIRLLDPRRRIATDRDRPPPPPRR